MSIRGYLWERLHEEVEAEFRQAHPLDGGAPPSEIWLPEGWLFFDPTAIEARVAGTSREEAARRRRAAGMCTRCRDELAPGSKNFCAYHVMMNRPSARKRRAAVEATPSQVKKPAADECPEHGRPLRLSLERGVYYCTKKGCPYVQEQRKRGMRERLVPDENKEQTRPGVTQHFKIYTRGPGGEDLTVDGYVTTGEYADGRLGEVFVKIGKPGSHEAMYDQWAIAVSLGLQYGVPMRVLLDKHVNTQFEPRGAVQGVAGIKRCSSPLDLICKWLIQKYGDRDGRTS
jgi:hypothetical protein